MRNFIASFMVDQYAIAQAMLAEDDADDAEGLMAAAPDLLGALERLMGNLPPPEFDADDDADSSYRNNYLSARAAIAKAKEVIEQITAEAWPDDSSLSLAAMANNADAMPTVLAALEDQLEYMTENGSVGGVLIDGAQMIAAMRAAIGTVEEFVEVSGDAMAETWSEENPEPPTPAHTPGPWHAQWRGTCPDRFTASAWYVCEQGGAQISTLYGPDKGADENAANGRLLAEAPAMLVALEAIVAAQGGGGPIEGWAAMALVEEAIAKAKGE